MRSGPWLLVHAQGSAPRGTVEKVRRQCEDAGITVDSVSIDACVPDETHIYACLVVVLPLILDQYWPVFVARLEALLRRYRAVRRDGLEAALASKVPWHRAGVVQIIGPQPIVWHPMLSESQHRICVRHDLSAGLLDVLAPYDPSTSPLAFEPIVNPVLDGDARCLPSWRYLRTWGIGSIRSIPTIRLRIEDCRKHFEDERYPALYRPVPGLDANRLSMILDGIPYKPTAQERKTYLENGARVWRYVLRELRRLEPGFARPNERTNTRDAQKDLRLFYASLCPVDEYLKLIPETDWETHFMAE